MKNIELVNEYFAAIAHGNFEKLDSLLSDTILWHQPGQGALSKSYKGKKEVFELFQRFMEISQGTFKIDRVISVMANNDLVAAYIHFSAQKGGQHLAMHGIDLMKISNGKIVEVTLFSEDQESEDNFWK